MNTVGTLIICPWTTMWGTQTCKVSTQCRRSRHEGRVFHVLDWFAVMHFGALFLLGYAALYRIKCEEFDILVVGIKNNYMVLKIWRQTNYCFYSNLDVVNITTNELLGSKKLLDPVWIWKHLFSSVHFNSLEPPPSCTNIQQGVTFKDIQYSNPHLVCSWGMTYMF